MSRKAPASEPSPAGADPKARLRLWIQFLKASKFVENELRDRLRREFNTTLPRFDVLAMLHKSGTGLKMSELSSELMVSNGNVTGIVDRLVADGLIMRVSIKGDRRATLVRLTPKGEEVFAEMATTHEGWVNDLLSGLEDDEMALVTDIAIRIRNDHQ